MKKWIWLLPAGAAVAAGAVLLIRRNGKDVPGEKKAPVQTKKPYQMASPASGTYSFVSGFQNAKTVEVSFTYDAEKYVCREIEEEFPAPTSVSHAELISGEDFELQIEYTDFAAGEDFSGYTALLREKQKGFAPVRYGSNEGFRYYNGDNVCFVFPATGFSCLLVTVILAKGSDLDYREIHDNEELAAFLAALSVR
ncbi:MAG: hypothetical protein J6P48_01825 [Oscillospiraceae bacterium]|nr:hypothetical protein [Oscillospiraceae bacterium]